MWSHRGIFSDVPENVKSPNLPRFQGVYSDFDMANTIEYVKLLGRREFVTEVMIHQAKWKQLDSSSDTRRDNEKLFQEIYGVVKCKLEK